MKLFCFKGEVYRWRERIGCDDSACGCGQERGTHPLNCGIGGADKEDALRRLRDSEEDDGCTVLWAELVGPEDGVEI